MHTAQTRGVQLRPSQPAIRMTGLEARNLRQINRALARRCTYDSVQQAVFDAGNNDRILIMPGLYEEPLSRSKPTNDPKCTPSLLQRDASGSLAPSYKYQVTCPNDQNLIFVQGRAVVGDALSVPRSDRQGIPAQELGPCVRCNLQIEGTGPRPEDVIMDAGKDYQGTGPAREARRVCEGCGPQGGSRRRFRGPQLRGARRARARLLHRRDRRRAARPDEVLLEP